MSERTRVPAVPVPPGSPSARCLPTFQPEGRSLFAPQRSSALPGCSWPLPPAPASPPRERGGKKGGVRRGLARGDSQPSMGGASLLAAHPLPCPSGFPCALSRAGGGEPPRPRAARPSLAQAQGGLGTRARIAEARRPQGQSGDWESRERGSGERGAENGAGRGGGLEYPLSPSSLWVGVLMPHRPEPELPACYWGPWLCSSTTRKCRCPGARQHTSKMG